MSVRVYILLALAVFVGFLLGWLARGPGERGDVVSSTRSTDRSAPGSGERSGARLSALREGARLGGDDLGDDDEDELLVTPEAVGALIGATVASLEERNQLVQTREPLERLLGVTKEEAATMNKLWDRMKPELDALRLANVKHQRLEDGGVWLGVEPFPEEGEEIRRGFLLTTLRVLGESRGRVFLDAIGAHGAFGQWGKTVGSGFTIHKFLQEDESLLYEIFEQTAANGEAGRKWNTSKIPAHLAEMASAVGITLSP